MSERVGQAKTCVICGESYVPYFKKGKRWESSKTCSKKCRVALRAQLQKEWRADMPEASREKKRATELLWRRSNAEKNAWYSKKWRSENAEAARRYRKHKYDNDLQYKFIANTRARIRAWIAKPGHKRQCGTADLIGAPWETVRAHIEQQFKPGMSWDNWAMDGWHMDHIRPCDSFDLSDPEQQKQCFHYTNLQPLWAEENLSKGARWEPVAS